MAAANQPTYVPTPLSYAMQTQDTQVLLQYIQRELQKIAQAVQQTTLLTLVPIDAAPPRPRAGMLAYADGTNWNPGSGEGLYVYKSGGWTFVA